jgi:hypothetical protein
MLMKKSERELKPKMVLKAIVLASSTLLMMKNSKTKFQKVIRALLNKRLNKLKDG